MQNINKFKKEQNATFAKNVMMLAAAQIIVKILGLVYKIVILNIDGFGNEGSGFYNTGYQLYMVLLSISSIGIPNVVSKMVSERIALGDWKGAKNVFKATLKLVSSVGFILAFLMFIFAKPISVFLFKSAGVSYTLMALAPAVLFVSINSVLRGYFTGLGSLKSTSISEIIEQLFNCILSIGFVLLAVGSDTAIMAAAGNLSTSVAVLISLGYMVSYYLLRRKYIKYECDNQEGEFQLLPTSKLIKNIAVLAIPASFASLVSTLSSNIDSITVNRYTGSVEAYGLMSKTETLTHLPLALGATLFIAIVPVISSKITVGDTEGAERQLSDTMFLNTIIMLPCAAGFIVLAEPILKLLFPNVSDGAVLLQLQTVAMLFASVAFVLNGVFYGIGKQKHPAIILLLGALLKLILNILVLSYFDLGVLGAIIATIIYQALVTIAEWVVLNKYIRIKINLDKQFLRPLLATFIMCAPVFMVQKILVGITGNTISTIVSIAVGVIVYCIMLMLLKIISPKDIIKLIKNRDKI